jgi:hypothetical protein
MAALLFLIYLAIVAVVLVGMWKVFTKAGQPGWAIFIPIYNGIVWLRIAGKPWWWFLLLLIPIVGIVIAVLATIDFAKNFGKGGGFVVGMLFLPFIFYPILGFGDAQYLGAVSQTARGFAPLMPESQQAQ